MAGSATGVLDRHVVAIDRRNPRVPLVSLPVKDDDVRAGAEPEHTRDVMRLVGRQRHAIGGHDGNEATSHGSAYGSLVSP
jgi:hypothetical protein